jgi:predicted metalloprotease
LNDACQPQQRRGVFQIGSYREVAQAWTLLRARTRNNERVTRASDNNDQPSPKLGGSSSASPERAAWEALKRFVDPPMGSSGVEVLKNSVSQTPTVAPISSPSDDRVSDVDPLRLGLRSMPLLSPLSVAPAASTISPLSVTPGMNSIPPRIAPPEVGTLPVGSSLPVKPSWPESIPSTEAARKRRRWPIFGLVALLLGGLVVALAKPSILPTALRRKLHVGSSTDRNDAAKAPKRDKKDADAESGSDGSTTTVAATRPKRAIKGYDPTMRLALTSIDRFWAKEFPLVYDDDYKKLSGGVYAYSSGSRIPTCDGVNLPYLVLQQNAFYCPQTDFIAWDDQGLFPRLEKKYGRFLLSIVLAHEWGHAIQERADSGLDTITAEQQADCFAGAWAASIDPKTEPELAKLRDTELDKGLSGFIEFRDLVGMVSTDPGAHGTAFDRIRAFQDGYEGTPDTCAYYEEELPELVAIPYRSFKERFRGGNLPYPEVLPSIKTELANNWKAVFSKAPTTTTEAKVFPVCFAQPVSPEGFTESTVSYCDDDKTLRYDEKSMRTLYDRIGDFGPATTIGVGWAMADLVTEGKDPSTKQFWAEANCRAGAWAGTMFDSNDPENSQLSPGDLDESVRTILESSAKGASTVYGTGFEQVSAFRAGVLQGSGGCKVLLIGLNQP